MPAKDWLLDNGCDLQGRRYLTFAEAKPGTQVQVDTDFDCIPSGATRTIHRARKTGALYIRCSAGHHDLEGQIDWNGGTFYVGLYPLDPLEGPK